MSGLRCLGLNFRAYSLQEGRRKTAKQERESERERGSERAQEEEEDEEEERGAYDLQV